MHVLVLAAAADPSTCFCIEHTPPTEKSPDSKRMSLAIGINIAKEIKIYSGCELIQARRRKTIHAARASPLGQGPHDEPPCPATRLQPHARENAIGLVWAATSSCPRRRRVHARLKRTMAAGNVIVVSAVSFSLTISFLRHSAARPRRFRHDGICQRERQKSLQPARGAASNAAR